MSSSGYVVSNNTTANAYTAAYRRRTNTNTHPSIARKATIAGSLELISALAGSFNTACNTSAYSSPIVSSPLA